LVARDPLVGHHRPPEERDLEMTLTVSLRGYPEAVLATDSIALDVPCDAPAEVVVQTLAGLSPRLGEALVHGDGSARKTTKVLVDGMLVDPSTPIVGAVTVLAALPCDG
jgi:hypothetical protein